eukprot:NODE_809_length_4047_cov_0.715805.p3 type:complete len:147 gc:universal NODE_809_length_4047_cov_0.715805:2151-1711(-)
MRDTIWLKLLEITVLRRVYSLSITMKTQIGYIERSKMILLLILLLALPNKEADGAVVPGDHKANSGYQTLKDLLEKEFPNHPTCPSESDCSSECSSECSSDCSGGCSSDCSSGRSSDCSSGCIYCKNEGDIGFVEFIQRFLTGRNT